MTWKWLLYATIFTYPTVFSKDARRTKRSDSDGKMPCEEGWYYFRQKCYTRLITRDQGAGLMTWNNAAYACHKQGGHLVSIHSKEELDFLVNYIILDYKYAVWIGLQNRDAQSEFSWQDKSPVNYTNWMEGRPTSNTACVLMLYNLNSIKNVLGKWCDWSCAGEYAVVCQKKIVDYCIEKCGESSRVKCVGNRFDGTPVECKCKRSAHEFYKELKECGVDYCALKCGANPGVKCSGHRLDEKAIECNCTEEGHSFDEERKECRVDYCITKCDERSDVECVNRFDEEAVECKCKAAGHSFDGESKECREDYCIKKCGNDPDLLCVGNRFENLTAIECNCRRNDQVFDVERKKCKVDYCISKCGENHDLECVGDRFDEKTVVCNCSREGHLFDEETKECRVDHCIEKCGEVTDVICLNRFDEATIVCNCSRDGYVFDKEKKECRVSTNQNRKDEELLKMISGREHFHAMIGLSVTLIIVLGLLGAAIFYFRRRIDKRNLGQSQAPYKSSKMSVLELKETEYENHYLPMCSTSS